MVFAWHARLAPAAHTAQPALGARDRSHPVCRYGISREAQDVYSVESQRRTAVAQANAAPRHTHCHGETHLRPRGPACPLLRRSAAPLGAERRRRRSESLPRPARSVYPAQRVCCRSPSLCPSPLPLPCHSSVSRSSPRHPPPSTRPRLPRACRRRASSRMKSCRWRRRCSSQTKRPARRPTRRSALATTHGSRLLSLIVRHGQSHETVCRHSSLLPLSRHAHFLPPPPLLAAASLHCPLACHRHHCRHPPSALPPPSRPRGAASNCSSSRWLLSVREQRLTRCSRIATSATGPAPRSRPSRG